MHEPIPAAAGLHDVQAAIPVIAEAVLHADDAGLHGIAAEQLAQRGARLLDCLRQAGLGEVELVGAVDQFDGAVDMRLQVMLDGDRETAAAEEFGIVGAVGLLLGLAAFEQLVLLEALQLAVVLALE